MSVREKPALRRERAESVAAEHPAAEHLRDQVFAALGYAFAVAALVAGLLAPHIGKVGEVTGVLLGVSLVPVNLWVIRRCAPLRRRGAAPR